MNFARPVQQPVDQIRVPRFALPRPRHAKRTPEVQRQKAVGAGRLGHGAFVHVEHNHPVEVQRARFCQPHDLQPAVGFAQQVHPLLTQHASCHGADFSRGGHGAMRILQPLQHRQHRPEPPPSGGDPWHRTRGPILVVAGVHFAGHGFQASLQGACPQRERFEKGRGFFRPKRGELPHILRKTSGAQFFEVVCTHPSAVGFGQGVHGATHPRVVPLRPLNVVHDRMGVEGLKLFQPPRVGGGLEHGEHLVDKRQHGGLVHGQAHGHIQPVGVGWQGLEQGPQRAPVGQHHQGLVELLRREVGEDVAHMLGLQDGRCAAHHPNLGWLAGEGALDKRRVGASEFADEQPGLVVDVVHVGWVGVPEHRQPVGLVPGVEALPFGRAHGGQTCRKHVIHVQVSFPFREVPSQVGAGGQAVLPQAGVQLGVQCGQPSPLTLERFLVLRPRLLPKAPILDALDVGQVLKHLAHVGQFVVHGREIVQHHLGPRHKPVKRQGVLGRAHHPMQPHQDFQRVRSCPR